MSLTPTELAQLKNVLGYGNLTALALPYIDVSLMFETVIANNLDAEGESLIRGYLTQVTQVELDVYNARAYYVASEIVGEVKINDKHHEKLVRLRMWLVTRCSETCKVPIARSQNRGATSEVY